MPNASPDMPSPSLIPIGDNPVPIWGMPNHKRVRRIAAQQRLSFDNAAAPRQLLANLAFVFDPAWSAHLARLPGTVLVADGRPVLAHVDAGPAREAVAAAMQAGAALPPDTGLAVIDAATPEGIYNLALRKRERPFVQPLTPATVPAIERASYAGAYKGVTDLLTKYLWPSWAFHLTRLAARIGLSPNGVTAIGTILCVVATILFWYGWFWAGMATGLVFMVLDTVDGKLARCTITSSPIGNLWDHGIDLVHPPFWWWAWAVGCAAYGRPLDHATFVGVMAVILFGYVAQRVIEGIFMRAFGMHIHVWRKADSDFRLVTARRNPNMVILFAAMLVARPDLGIIAVAIWTVISLVFHLVRLIQAFLLRKSGGVVESWLA